MILVVDVVDGRHVQLLHNAGVFRFRLLVLLAFKLVFLELLLVGSRVLEFYVRGFGAWVRAGLVEHRSGLDAVWLEGLLVAR